MPRLGDVIGSMLADVAMARVRSDVEAVRIAEAYSRDPLLKNLAVPRFRMPDIVVDLPVLVGHFDEAGTAADAWQVTEPKGAEIREAVRNALSQTDVKLTDAQRGRAAAAAALRAKELFGAPGRMLAMPGQISSELASAAAGAIGPTTRAGVPPEQLRVVEQQIRAAVTTLLATKIVPSPALEVLVAAEDIKAHADPNNVVRLRLTITEDAYEIIERDDGSGYFLSPE